MTKNINLNMAQNAVTTSFASLLCFLWFFAIKGMSAGQNLGKVVAVNVPRISCCHSAPIVLDGSQFLPFQELNRIVTALDFGVGSGSVERSKVRDHVKVIMLKLVQIRSGQITQNVFCWVGSGEAKLNKTNM